MKKLNKMLFEINCFLKEVIQLPKFILLFGGFIVISIDVFCQEYDMKPVKIWQEDIEVSDGTSGDYDIDYKGNIHIVFRLNEQPYYTLLNQDGGILIDPEVIAEKNIGNVWSSMPAVAVDKKGTPHVVFNHDYELDNSEHRLYYSKRENKSWTKPVLIDSVPPNPVWNQNKRKKKPTNRIYLPSIAIDKDNNLHVLAFARIDSIHYNKLHYYLISDNNNVERTIIDTSALSGMNKVVVDKKNRIHAFWTEEWDGLFYRMKDPCTGLWGKSVLLNNEEDHQSFPLGVDVEMDEDTIHILYSGHHESHINLYYRSIIEGKIRDLETLFYEKGAFLRVPDKRYTKNGYVKPVIAKFKKSNAMFYGFKYGQKTESLQYIYSYPGKDMQNRWSLKQEIAVDQSHGRDRPIAKGWEDFVYLLYIKNKKLYLSKIKMII